jgi:hypothetical protein
VDGVDGAVAGGAGKAAGGAGGARGVPPRRGRRGVRGDAAPVARDVDSSAAVERDDEQRDLLASVPRWYLAPFVPGMALFIAGVTLDRLAAGATMAAIAPGLARGVGEIVGIFALVALLNYVTSRKLTRAIAALDD